MIFYGGEKSELCYGDESEKMKTSLQSSLCAAKLATLSSGATVKGFTLSF